MTVHPFSSSRKVLPYAIKKNEVSQTRTHERGIKKETIDSFLQNTTVRINRTRVYAEMKKAPALCLGSALISMMAPFVGVFIISRYFGRNIASIACFFLNLIIFRFFDLSSDKGDFGDLRIS